MYSLITISNMTISQGLHQPQTTSEEDELIQILQNFWQLESLGIQQQSLSEQDEQVDILMSKKGAANVMS